MAGRIQGITAPIGDTTKLQTALKGVNTEIRNTQSQLRDAVKETKEKLETLKTAAEQAEQALKDDGKPGRQRATALHAIFFLACRRKYQRGWTKKEKYKV